MTQGQNLKITARVSDGGFVAGEVMPVAAGFVWAVRDLRPSQANAVVSEGSSADYLAAVEALSNAIAAM